MIGSLKKTFKGPFAEMKDTVCDNTEDHDVCSLTGRRDIFPVVTGQAEALRD